jgi:hypothetical protein
LDFTPATGDLALYIRRGVGVSQIARLTGLSEPLVRAFYEGYHAQAVRERAPPDFS